jgi:hypothetical protein
MTPPVARVSIVMTVIASINALRQMAVRITACVIPLSANASKSATLMAALRVRRATMTVCASSVNVRHGSVVMRADLTERMFATFPISSASRCVRLERVVMASIAMPKMVYATKVSARKSMRVQDRKFAIFPNTCVLKNARQMRHVTAFCVMWMGVALNRVPWEHVVRERPVIPLHCSALRQSVLRSMDVH